MMKLTTAAKLGRVSNLPTVWTNVLAGCVLAGGSLGVATVLTLGVLATLLYVAGMFLNDAFDAEIDARERPERPIPAGEVSRAVVLRFPSSVIVISPDRPEDFVNAISRYARVEPGLPY